MLFLFPNSQYTQFWKFLKQQQQQKTLEICDSQLVTMVIAQPSGRYFFQVEGSAAFPYTCFFKYCTCPAFLNASLLKDEAMHVSIIIRFCFV